MSGISCNMRSKTLRALGISVATAAVAAASASCGSSGPSSSSTGVDAQAQAQARSELVVLSDFPPRWSEHGSVSNGGTSALSGPQSTGLASCLGAPVSVINSKPPAAESPTFNDPTGALTVDDRAQVFATPDAARQSFEILTEPQAPNCLVRVLGSFIESQIAASLSHGQHIGQITATSKPFGGYGDSSAELELLIPISAQAQNIEVYADLFDILKGRSETSLLTLSLGSPFPLPVAGQLASTAAARMS